jgi:hypothetical protein
MRVSSKDLIEFVILAYLLCGFLGLRTCAHLQRSRNIYHVHQNVKGDHYPWGIMPLSDDGSVLRARGFRVPMVILVGSRALLIPTQLFFFFAFFLTHQRGCSEKLLATGGRITLFSITLSEISACPVAMWCSFPKTCDADLHFSLRGLVAAII